MTKCDFLTWLSADWILGVSAVAALVFVRRRWRTISAEKRTRTIKGQAKVDAKNSWISNTTLLGAVLASALKDLKDVKDLTALDGITGLNLAFAMIALVAILVQLGASRYKDNDQAESDVRYYLLSVFLAIWAVTGQMLTLGRIAAAVPDSTLTLPATIVCVLVLCFALTGALFYAWKATYEHIVPRPKAEKKTVTPAETAAAVEAVARAAGTTDAVAGPTVIMFAAEDVSPERRQWSVL